ncbi:MAG: DUF1624 domain-containing protein [Rivularia sp. (in: Bacteria)]|nr:DUF1624 domain-containing protein [Rivularia sp. MS3]
MKKRDYSLDVIKGIACILMLIAHSQINISNKLIFFVTQMSGFAPILFFAVSGVTTTFQIAKNKISNIFVFYFLLALLGISYNAIWRPQNIFDRGIECNILQIIAIGVIIVSLIEYYFKPPKVYYLLFTAVTFGIHYLFTQILQTPNLIFTHFLFVGDAAGKTFPIFPWVSIFFMGIFAYYIKNYGNLFISLSIIFYSLILLFFHPQYISLVDKKWDMSLVYFLRSSSLLFLSFYIARKYIRYFSDNNILVWLGKNSLLFLYIHFIPVMFLFPSMKIDNAYLVWLSRCLISILIMQAVKYLNKFIANYFTNIYVWILMLAVILIIPIILNNLTTIKYLELGVGILFASNYQVLPKLLKQIE